MQDARTGLKKGTSLAFPGLAITLEEEIGRGSNSLVYQGFYHDSANGERHTVLVKELFPLCDGVSRSSECGRICCGEAARRAFEVHRAGFQAGNQAHVRLQEKSPDVSSLNINTYAFNETLYTVLSYTGGRSLEAAQPGPHADLRLLTLRMLGLLDALEAFHANGLLHLDIAPDNILLTGQGGSERVMLIDFNSVRAICPSENAALDYHSEKPGYVAPEVKLGNNGAIGPASDLYSVAAVFFSSLTGRLPGTRERSGRPDLSGAAALEGQPETVKALVRDILATGLHPLARARYQSTAAMREVFEELRDRIDGRGVTHWALWEAGRRMVADAVGRNPALSYLLEADGLYPSNVKTGGGVRPFSEWFEELTGAAGGSVLLTAHGGMGKTTALLRAVMTQSKRYSPEMPALIYLSMYGCRADGSHCIRDWLLNRLHFKRADSADAMRELMQLMSSPLESAKGERPALVILLDGLNELSGDTQPLIEEMEELSHLKGVRLLAASRSSEAGLSMDTAQLTPLSPQDVEDALLRKGVLLPENPHMRELLRTPMMLSIFLASSQEEQQFRVSTRQELIEAYFDALLAKENGSAADHQEKCFQAQAAVRLVLPELAREIHRAGGALGSDRLSPAVKRCWKLLDLPNFHRIFPDWYGHSSAMRGQCQTVEQWYGVVVHDWLWKRLGLLMRDEEGRYQLPHEILKEHLLKTSRKNRLHIMTGRWGRRLRNALILLVVLGAVLAPLYSLWPKPYDSILAETVYAEMANHYQLAIDLCEDMQSLVDCAVNQPQNYRQQLALFESGQQQMEMIDGTDRSIAALKSMYDKGGNVMPWSYRGLDFDGSQDLLTFCHERRRSYMAFLDALTFVVEDERAREPYAAQYLEGLLELTRLDAQIATGLYYDVCVPHMRGKFGDDSLEGKLLQISQLEAKNHETIDRNLGDGLRRELEKQLLILQERAGYMDDRRGNE